MLPQYIYINTSQQHQLNQRHTSYQKIIFIHIISLQQQAACSVCLVGKKQLDTNWNFLGHLLWPFNLSIFNNYTVKFHHDPRWVNKKVPQDQLTLPPSPISYIAQGDGINLLSMWYSCKIAHLALRLLSLNIGPGGLNELGSWIT
jgi:hypothetical protein